MRIFCGLLLATGAGGFTAPASAAGRAPARPSRLFAAKKPAPGSRGRARAKERLARATGAPAPVKAPAPVHARDAVADPALAERVLERRHLLREALAQERAAAAPAPIRDEHGRPVPVRAAAPATSRVEQRRKAGLPPIEPMLKKAPPSLLVEAPVGLPSRWQKVPDCERPQKWREVFDNEDCKFEKKQKKLDKEAEVQGKKINDPYVEIIPQLKTLDDFLKANALAQKRQKAIVVKFYSRQCRACLRIAAKYRRLALEKRDEIDCYEVESLSSRPLIDGLNVSKVPSVQIYDPDGVTRLADGPCMPDDFSRLERKVDVVIRSMQKRRSAHKFVATSYAAELCQLREDGSKDCAPSLSATASMDDSDFDEFAAAVCAICPPSGRMRGALRTKESAAVDSS